jgi:hypothetical protein
VKNESVEDVNFTESRVLTQSLNPALMHAELKDVLERSDAREYVLFLDALSSQQWQWHLELDVRITTTFSFTWTFANFMCCLILLDYRDRFELLLVLIHGFEIDLTDHHRAFKSADRVSATSTPILEYPGPEPGD